MRKTAVATVGLLLSSFVIDYALAAHIPLPACQETKLAERLIKRAPFFPVKVDFSEFSRQLQILRARPQPAPVYMGVSQPIARGKVTIRAGGALSGRVTETRNGLIVRCGDTILFATSIGVPTNGSYSLAVAMKEPNIATVSLVDSSMTITSPRFVATPNKAAEVIASTRSFKGPIAVLIVALPRKVRYYEISLTHIIPVDWPTNPQALIPSNWSPAKLKEVVPQQGQPSPELDAAKTVVGPLATNDQNIPQDFLDYECMKNHNLFNRFPADLRNHVNSIGLLETYTWDGPYIDVSYCTGTLVTFDRDPLKRAFFLTANHCFVGDVRRDTQPNDILSATVFWDYRNAQCTNGAPARWPDSLIHSLPNTNLTLAAATTKTDSAILNLDLVPTDRVPLRAGGTPDYTANNVFRMRFHHSDVRPLMGSEPFWDWKSEPGFPSGGYSAPCESFGFPGSDFFYSMWIVHNQSSAIYEGASGSAVIDQTGHVVGQLQGWCHGSMSHGGPYYNYNVDGKIERSLSIFGFP
jgi:hypothetical protein